MFLYDVIERALREFGLSDKEIDVYLAALKHGEATASTIAQAASVRRENTYAVLRRLAEDSLITHVKHDGVKHFSATQPERFLEIVDHKRSLIEDALPDLQRVAAKPSPDTPEAETYLGKDGLKAMLEDVLRAYNEHSYDEALEGYGSAGKFEAYLQWRFPHFIDRRSDLGIHYKGIYNESEAGREKQRLPDASIRLLPERFEANTFTLLYPGTVLLFIFSDTPVGITIRSTEIYESYTMYFDVLWEQGDEP